MTSADELSGQATPEYAAGPSLAARILVLLVTGYRRFISPMMGPHCRFYPSCSAYALGAVRAHGALRGSWLTVRRLSRCHPFHPGGIDPVPLARPARARTGQPAGPAAGTAERTAAGRPAADRRTRELASG